MLSWMVSSPPNLAPHGMRREGAGWNVPFQPQKLICDLPRVDLRARDEG